MITTSQIEEKIKQNLKTLLVEVVDLRGGDHIQAIVVSPEFEGKTLVEQHKTIYDILSEEMKSNEIHALTLKTYSPSQWEKIKGTFNRDIGHAI
jgi:stress-induced morphogen